MTSIIQNQDSDYKSSGINTPVLICILKANKDIKQSIRLIHSSLSDYGFVKKIQLADNKGEWKFFIEMSTIENAKSAQEALQDFSYADVYFKTYPSDRQKVELEDDEYFGGIDYEMDSDEQVDIQIKALAKKLKNSQQQMKQDLKVKQGQFKKFDLANDESHSLANANDNTGEGLSGLSLLDTSSQNKFNNSQNQSYYSYFGNESGKNTNNNVENTSKLFACLDLDGKNQQAPKLKKLTLQKKTNNKTSFNLQNDQEVAGQSTNKMENNEDKNSWENYFSNNNNVCSFNKDNSQENSLTGSANILDAFSNNQLKINNQINTNFNEQFYRQQNLMMNKDNMMQNRMGSTQSQQQQNQQFPFNFDNQQFNMQNNNSFQSMPLNNNMGNMDSTNLEILQKQIEIKKLELMMYQQQQQQYAQSQNSQQDMFFNHQKSQQPDPAQLPFHMFPPPPGMNQQIQQQPTANNNSLNSLNRLSALPLNLRTPQQQQQSQQQQQPIFMQDDDSESIDGFSGLKGGLQNKQQRKSKVIYARWFEKEKVSLKMLYNIFQCYGNVMKMIYMKEKLSCLVEYQSIEHAEIAKECLNGICYFGQNIKTFYSNHDGVFLKQLKAPTQGKNSENQEEYFIGDESTWRFKVGENPKVGQNVYGPSDTLQITNIPKTMTRDQIFQIFSKVGALTNFISQNDEATNTISCFITYKNKQIALETLSITNNTKIDNNQFISVGFAKK